jgi:hypothetical protein
MATQTIVLEPTTKEELTEILTIPMIFHVKKTPKYYSIARKLFKPIADKYNTTTTFYMQQALRDTMMKNTVVADASIDTNIVFLEKVLLETFQVENFASNILNANDMWRENLPVLKVLHTEVLTTRIDNGRVAVTLTVLLSKEKEAKKEVEV